MTRMLTIALLAALVAAAAVAASALAVGGEPGRIQTGATGGFAFAATSPTALTARHPGAPRRPGAGRRAGVRPDHRSSPPPRARASLPRARVRG